MSPKNQSQTSVSPTLPHLCDTSALETFQLRRSLCVSLHDVFSTSNDLFHYLYFLTQLRT